MTKVDWPALRTAAVDVMRRAYAPYSNYPVGAAALVDDGRIVVGCNVENAAYGVVLCAECGVVSSLHATGGGRLVALACVDGAGEALMPCGRCRQLLWEQGGPDCLIDHADGPLTIAELLPHAFGAEDLDKSRPPVLPARVRDWQGRGTVFVHPDVDGRERVWTAYWEKSGGAGTDNGERGILEEGPTWRTVDEPIAWGRARSPRVILVDSDGDLWWAGTGEQPADIERRWETHDVHGG